MSRKGWKYIAHYRCGCTEEAARKKDLVGYCSTHGQDLLEPIIPLPPKVLMDRIVPVGRRGATQ